MLHKLMKSFVKLLLFLLGALPAPLNRLLAYLLAWSLYGVYRLTPYRNFIYHNLEQVFTDQPAAELHRLALKNIEHLALNLMEFIRFPYLSAEKLKRLIRVEGLDHFTALVSRGYGAVCTSAHFGNWELLGLVTASLGHCPFVLAVRQASIAEELICEYRQSKGVTTISRWNSLRPVLRLLKQNKVIGVLNDQHGEFNNLLLDFFGQRVSVPGGPANFAILGKTAILPTFIVRQPDFSHILYFEPPIYPDPTLNKKENVAAMTASYLEILERYIRAYPEQWFWVYNRFDKLPQSVAL